MRFIVVGVFSSFRKERHFSLTASNPSISLLEYSISRSKSFSFFYHSAHFSSRKSTVMTESENKVAVANGSHPSTSIPKNVEEQQAAKRMKQIVPSVEPTVSSEAIMALEKAYGAHNYHPIPVVFSKGLGAHVWDPEGKRYLDFLSAYSAVNQGHCHPKLVQTMVEQASQLTLASRAFYNNRFGVYAKFITEYFGYEMVLPVNTGAEGVETALKLARKWGYLKKGIKENEAIILACEGNFHGRTLGVISMSSDPEATRHFGPFVPKIGYQLTGTGEKIRYNNLEDLRLVLDKYGKNVAAFLVEPIQGEAGIVVPNEGYLKGAFDLCKKHNVLFMVDEIQTGLGRTGKLLAVDYENLKPDVLILGKALSGGMYPVGAVLSSNEIMLCIKPGEHGSTYGGNPLACALATAALQILKDEKLAERAAVLGETFRKELALAKSPLIREIRGKGLMNALVMDESLMKDKTAWHFCLLLKSRGVLAKPTHQNIVRFTPPLVISESDLRSGIDIIKRSLEDIVQMNLSDIPDMGK